MPLHCHIPLSCSPSPRHQPTSTAAAGVPLYHRPSLSTPSTSLPSIRFKPTRNFPSIGSIRSSSRAGASAAVFGTTVAPAPIKLTHLESNSWLWDVAGVNILVDPILIGNLDFGLPWLYDGAKKYLRHFKLEDLPELDLLLITQSLDDHCHVKTLTPLSKMRPDLRVIATPNAEAILSTLFKNVTYLEPGQKLDAEGKTGSRINVCATAGPILGPPWQRPENGYIVESGQNRLRLYYEPHCVYDKSFLQNYEVDIVITPVIKQVLPAFTLVSGQEDAVQLVKLLKAKYIVPMKNGDLDAKGILSGILYAVGTTESFKNQNEKIKKTSPPLITVEPIRFQELLAKELPNARVLEPTPGVPLEIPIAPVVS